MVYINNKGDLIICDRCNKKILNVNPNQKYCPECSKNIQLERDREYSKRPQIKEKRKEYIKIYMKTYKDKFRKYHKEYRIENKEILKKKNKQWREMKLGRKIKDKINKLPKSFLKPTFELGYALGALKGDGCIYYNGKSGNTKLEVRDKDFADYLKEKLHRIYPYKISYKEEIEHGKGWYILRIFSRDVCRFLKEYDMDSILNHPEYFKRGFLKGFFDAEGGVTALYLNDKGRAIKRINFVQKDYNIILLVSKLLNGFGISHNIQRRNHSGFKESCIHYVINIYTHKNLSIFREKIGFSIKRKQDNLDLAIKSFIIERDCIECGKRFKIKSATHIRCYECSKIHKMGYQKKYDLNMRIEKLKRRYVFCVDCGENIYDKLLNDTDIRIKRCDECQKERMRILRIRNVKNYNERRILKNDTNDSCINRPPLMPFLQAND